MNPPNNDHATLGGSADFDQDIVRLVGSDTVLYKNIYPSEPYRAKHFHIFMNAMQPGSEWLYHGDIPTSPTSCFFAVGPCMRTDGGLQAIGKSPKRLLLFQMLGYEWMIAPSDIETHIAHVHEKITNLLREKTTIGCRIHPDTQNTIGAMMKNLGIHAEHERECVFDEPDRTDRSGYRIEFITENEPQVELFNLVILTCIKNAELSRYILDGGGSLERMLMIGEEHDSGDQTTIFPLAPEIYSLWNPEEHKETKRRIMNLIRGIAYLKINGVAVTQHSQHGSIHKTLSTLYRMLYIAFYSILGDFDTQKLIGCIQKEILYISGSEILLDDLREKLIDIEQQKQKILDALRKDPLPVDNLQKIANRYCGGCLILPRVLKDHITKPEQK